MKQATEMLHEAGLREQIKLMISNYQPDPAALVVPPWGRDAVARYRCGARNP